MAITTSGGSGTGSTVVSAAGTNITLFTTPSTTNAMFIVTWFICTSDNDIGIAAGNISGSGGGKITPTFAGSAGGVIRVGPSTAVIITAVAENITCKWNYNYLGIVMS